ncbi:MAG: hypothetical protein KBT72_03850 [Zhongshania sp.]|nr:hypothetical protein [Zhongshania sp.]
MMVDYQWHSPENKKKYRDIALVSTGFFRAFRRSRSRELVAILIGDLVWKPEGQIILLSHSKTNQQSSGVACA